MVLLYGLKLPLFEVVFLLSLPISQLRGFVAGRGREAGNRVQIVERLDDFDKTNLPLFAANLKDPERRASFHLPEKATIHHGGITDYDPQEETHLERRRFERDGQFESKLVLEKNCPRKGTER